MLFYEPMFVTFFAGFYALYLLATGWITKKSALLIASVLFYLWGEPVFVLVLLLSTTADAGALPGVLFLPKHAGGTAQLVPQYVGALRDAGIDVLDGAGLIHALKGHYDVDLFPQGGEHWNDLGGTLVVSALVKQINAWAGRDELQRNLSDVDVATLRDAKLMIIEENESFVSRNRYVDDVLRAIGRF